MQSNYAAWLHAAAELVQANPDAPQVSSIRVADGSLVDEAPVHIQVHNSDDVFGWALLLDSVVRLTDRGTFLFVSASTTVDGIEIELWTHADGREARALLDQCDWHFDHDARAYLDPTTGRVAGAHPVAVAS